MGLSQGERERLERYNKNPVSINESQQTQEDYHHLFNKSKTDRPNQSSPSIAGGIKRELMASLDIGGHVRHQLEVARIKREAKRGAELEYASKIGREEAKEKLIRAKSGGSRQPSYMSGVGKRALDIFDFGGGSDDYARRTSAVLGSSDSGSGGMSALEAFEKKHSGASGLADFEKRANAALLGKQYHEKSDEEKQKSKQRGGAAVHIHIDR